MFGENLKTLRKQKGFSQEELATRLHVVRQTISKWEKNLSVPDADKESQTAVAGTPISTTAVFISTACAESSYQTVLSAGVT